MALSLLLLLAMTPQAAESPAAHPTDTFAEVPLMKVIPGTWSPWMEHLQPNAKEAAFATLEWRPTFAQGILDANQAQMPLLLWVMNGHPLGCT